MQLPFLKMHCLGDDFMVVEFITQEGYIRNSSVAKLAERVTGIGFRYLLVLEHPRLAQDDFYCRQYNAQGEEVELTPSAARCGARFAHERGLTGKSVLRMSSYKTTITVDFQQSRRVAVLHALPVLEPELIPFQAERFRSEYDMPVPGFGQVLMSVVQVGLPQVVVRVDDLEHEPLAQMGLQISQAQYFQQQVAVHFMQTVDEQHLRLRSILPLANMANEFGAAAAVVAARLKGAASLEVTVALAGGEVQVDWAEQQYLKVSCPVAIAYDGQVYL